MLKDDDAGDMQKARARREGLEVRLTRCDGG